VALTRAKECLFIITENQKMSPYLADIKEHVAIPEIDWEKYPPVTGETNVLVVRISGQFFALTDEFKADGFQFRRQNGKPYRDKKYLREGFAMQKLQNTPWAQKAQSFPDSRFDVSVLDGFSAVFELYSVVAGRWTKHVVPVVNVLDTAFLVAKSGVPFEKKTQEYLQLRIEEEDEPF
jgi:hypothetical protein